MPAPSGRHGSFNAKILGGENVKNKFVKILFVALAVMIVFVSSCVSAFALSDEYSSVDVFQADFIKQFLLNDDTFKECSKQCKDYFVICSGSATGRKCITVVFIDDNHFTPNYSYGDVRYYFTQKSRIFYEYSVPRNAYVKFNNVEGSNETFLTGASSSAISYSTVDLINSSDGSIFFHRPLTLLERLLNPVQSQVGEKVVADLGILTTCGIGCLALLIGLSLLPKVLYKFL